MNDFTVSSPVVFEVPPQNEKVIQAQRQGTPADTFSALKQFVFFGGLNPTVGTTRYKLNKGILHIAKVSFSIKAKPTNECITSLGYYNGKNQVELFRYDHKILVHDIAGDNEEYSQYQYDFIPPLQFQKESDSDYFYIKTDGSSDGTFTFYGFEQLF